MTDKSPYMGGVKEMQITRRGLRVVISIKLHLEYQTAPMTYRIILLLLTILNCSIANARQGNITGKVINAEGKPVSTANVVLLQEGNKLVRADLTDDNGVFTIDAISDGAYTLKITLSGYETYSDEKLSVSGSNVQLGEIKLVNKTTILKEVSVRAQKPFIEVQADKLVVNVENSIVSAGSSALEILARSPGVKVDQNDNISLKGKQGVNVMIDGKRTVVSGDELANMLKSMPANAIDKIEIISNPGAKYDAAGTAGVINIRTKRDQRMGMNGSVSLSYSQGVYPKANLGTNLNYRTKKFNVYANINYSYRQWFNHLMLNRRFYDTGATEKKLFTYDQDNYAVYNFKNPSVSVGTDYNLSERTTIGVSVTGAVNNFEPEANNASKALGANEELLYDFNTTGRHFNRYRSIATNVNLRHNFDTAGRQLSVDADYAAYDNKSNQNFVTTYTAPDGSMYLPDYYLKSYLNGVTQIRSLKADYTHPLKDKTKIETGFKTSFVTADSDPSFYELVSGVYQLDAKRSNHFIYNENINAVYGNANKEWEKWSAQLGLRVENTQVEANQVTLKTIYRKDYTQLFPSFAVQRHLDAKNDLGITLSRRIERPNYQQLNPFKFFIDKTTYKEGYPYLNPALSYNAELSYTFKQKFVTTFTTSITNDVITEVIQPSDNEDSVTVQTDKNLTRMMFYGMSGSYPFQITRWWTSVLNYNVFYARYEGFIANTNLNNGKITGDVTTTNSFLLPKEFSAELSFRYEARQLYAYMDVNPVWMLNAGIQKNLLAKRATLRLNVQDIFWHGYPSATSIYKGYQEDFVAQRDTRQVTVSFVYRFGKRTVAPIRRRSGGAEEEKQRAANNA